VKYVEPFLLREMLNRELMSILWESSIWAMPVSVLMSKKGGRSVKPQLKREKLVLLRSGRKEMLRKKKKGLRGKKERKKRKRNVRKKGKNGELLERRRERKGMRKIKRTRIRGAAGVVREIANVLAPVIVGGGQGVETDAGALVAGTGGTVLVAIVLVVETGVGALAGITSLETEIGIVPVKTRIVHIEMTSPRKKNGLVKKSILM